MDTKQTDEPTPAERTADEQVRRLFAENAARLDLRTFRNELGERLPSRQRRRPSRVVRVASLAALAAIVLAMLGFGINTLVDRYGRDENVVVITDDSMNPGTATVGAGEAAGEVSPAAAAEAAGLTGDKAELYTEIQRIREGVEAGTLVFEWSSDPAEMLDSLERGLFSPDVTVYLTPDLDASAPETQALEAEILAQPEVSRVALVSKEDALARLKETYKDQPEIFESLPGNPLPVSLQIWLSDYREAEVFAERFRDRPGVDDTRAAQTDWAAWTDRLRNLTHESDESGSIQEPYDFAQESYDSGRYMGYWAGNVETIPAQSGHLPDFFFTGPTPSAPVSTDSDGNPIQPDPAAIGKPLWVFGDEVRLTDYYDQIRQAKADQRPVLFYATSETDACAALEVERTGWSSTPLELQIVCWVPWGATLDTTIGGWQWTERPGATDPAWVFLMLVDATLTY
jgi:hypothetical protein